MAGSGSFSSDDSEHDYFGGREVYALVGHEDSGPSGRAPSLGMGNSSSDSDDDANLTAVLRHSRKEQYAGACPSNTVTLFEGNSGHDHVEETDPINVATPIEGNFTGELFEGDGEGEEDEELNEKASTSQPSEIEPVREKRWKTCGVLSPSHERQMGDHGWEGPRDTEHFRQEGPQQDADEIRAYGG